MVVWRGSRAPHSQIPHPDRNERSRRQRRTGIAPVLALLVIAAVIVFILV